MTSPNAHEKCFVDNIDITKRKKIRKNNNNNNKKWSNVAQRVP